MEASQLKLGASMCSRKGCCRSGPSRSSCPDSAACDGGLNEDSYSRFLPKTCQDFSQLHNVILSNTEFKGRHHCHRKITIGYEAKLLCGNGLQLHEIATMAKHTSSNTSPENFASQRWQELGGWRLWGQKPCTMEVAPLDLEDCLFLWSGMASWPPAEDHCRNRHECRRPRSAANVHERLPFFYVTQSSVCLYDSLLVFVC